MLVETIRGNKTVVTAGISVMERNFVAATAIIVEKGNTLVAINPNDSIFLETDSAPHMVLRSLSKPDSKIPRKDVSVKKKFANKLITLNGSDNFTAGYLFFPSDIGATQVTEVVELGGEQFRFPFVRNPNARAKFISPSPASSLQVQKIESSTSKLREVNLPNDLIREDEPRLASISRNASLNAMKGLTENQADKKQDRLPSGSCSRSVAFAVAEGGQVVPRVPDFIAKWIQKNARKFPNLCFSQSPNAQAENFAVIFSTSQSAFNGIYPTVRTRSQTVNTPIYGSGTITSNYGSTWNYTYQGTATTTYTTTSQLNLPYSDTTRSLFANTYNQSGNVVSSRWRSITTRQGGESYNTLGYNLGAALGGIHIKERLLKDVIKDIAR